MMLGKIVGKATTTKFQFLATHPQTKKLQFIQVHHSLHGFVLAQITELERTQEQLLATCIIIGYKDADNRIKGVQTPFAIGAEVLAAQDEFIQEIIKLDSNGAYIGKLEGKDIPIYLDLQKALTRHVAILAKTGAGKSYSSAVVIEEILQKRVPLIILDPHGEYSSLTKPNTKEAELLTRWNIEPSTYQVNEYGLEHPLLPLKLSEKLTTSELVNLLPIQLTPTQESLLFSALKDVDDISFDNLLFSLEQIQSHGKWTIIDAINYLKKSKLFSVAPTPLQELITPGTCSIINLRGIDPELQECIAYKLLQDLFTARKRNQIPPFFCVVEEAHNFCPERGFGKAKSTETLRLIASEGRKFGMGLCVITQRPALVQKTVLSQCNTQIILKVTNPNDLKAITSSLEGITPEAESEIQTLPIGSALVCGVVERPLLVHIRPRKTLHGGTAVDMLKQEPQEVNIQEELEEHQAHLPLILPQTSKKDLELMATGEHSIVTYFIPAVLLTCTQNNQQFNLLVDKVKGKVIVNPEQEITTSLAQATNEHHFSQKVTYTNFQGTQEIPAQLTTQDIIPQLSTQIQVQQEQDCFIVFHKLREGK